MPLLDRYTFDPTLKLQEEVKGLLRHNPTGGTLPLTLGNAATMAGYMAPGTGTALDAVTVFDPEAPDWERALSGTTAAMDIVGAGPLLKAGAAGVGALGGALGLLNRLGASGPINRAGRMFPKQRGIFIGEKGMRRLGADADVEGVHTMEANGASPEEIWRDFQAYKGPDDKWRFEIPDRENPVRMNYIDRMRDRQLPETIALKIEDIYHAPEVMEAYPDIARSLVVDARKRYPGEYFGYFDPDSRAIGLEPNLIDEYLDEIAPVTGTRQEAFDRVATHEIEHAIQDEEGWIPGADRYTAFMRYMELDRAAEDMLKELSRSMENQGFSDDYYSLIQQGITPGELSQAVKPETERLFREMGPYITERDRIAEAIGVKDDPGLVLEGRRRMHELYRHVFGEMEARNAETRLSMSPAERAVIPPWRTVDVNTGMDEINSMDDVPALARAFLLGGDLSNSPNSISPMKLYHGSPYEFDMFDSAKIGSGEGAQAFGTGIYLAENRDVARSYAPDFNPHSTLYEVDFPDEKAELLLDFDSPLAEQSPKVREILERELGSTFPYTPYRKNEWSDWNVMGPDGRLMWREGTGEFTEADARKAAADFSAGYWRDPDKIGRDLYTAIGIRALGLQDPYRPGKPSHKNYEDAQMAASKFLRERGIPGMKFLDAGSRDYKGGRIVPKEGATRNVIIFPGEEESLKILKKSKL